MREDIRKKIGEIEEEGCSRDLLNGYTCGIHKLVRELLDLLKPVPPEDFDTEWDDAYA